MILTTDLTNLCRISRSCSTECQGDSQTSARNLVRIRLLILLLVFILLATFIGPFTAVLLIPRTQTFPAGGTRYFLNATAEEMWPSVVHSDAEYEACLWPNATDYSVCPSGGYASFRT